MGFDEWLNENRKQMEEDFADQLQDQFEDYCKSIYEDREKECTCNAECEEECCCGNFK